MKRNTRKHTINVAMRMKDQKIFYYRLRIACDLLVGEGYFERFSIHSLKMMYASRYPPVRYLRDNNSPATLIDILNFKDTLNKLLLIKQVDTLTGRQMSYLRFLSEGLLLIHYVEHHIGGSFRGAASLTKAFSPYFTDGDWHQRFEDATWQLIALASLYLHDPLKGRFWANISGMPLVQPSEGNIIRLRRVRHQTCQQEIDGKKRVLIRVGVPNLGHPELDWLNASPIQLGSINNKDPNPKPVYIQQHALIRFAERTSFPEGFVPVILTDILANVTNKYHWRDGRTLLELRTKSGHRLGYFVISDEVDKWVVRTFLFLTNETTPEGNRLTRLTHLGRLDTQYLKIDRLSTFMTFDVGGDEQLRQLFTEAGCASLLDFVEELRLQGDISLQSPEYIHQYLAHLFLLGDKLPSVPHHK